MIIKLLKDHLPWVAPTVAIVFAASGLFDRSFGSDETVVAPQSELLNTNTASFSQGTAPAAMQVEPQAGDTEVVTRLSSVTNSSLEMLQPAPQPEIAAAAQPILPKPAAPAPVETQTAALDTSSSLAFFADAQAKLSARESCIGDLRALSEQSKVYFPAGGLTADESGIEQARLLASLVQDCKGVQIIVEGHSDPSGDPAVNLRLSKKRAEQVIQRLGASGLDTSFFTAEGMGSSVPSKVIGPKSSAFYDRRVEFVVIETDSLATTNRFKAKPSEWASSTCVKDLKNAISQKQIFYAPRSVAAKADDLDIAMELAGMAMACPNARLRVIGQHSDDIRAGENPATGRLRAKAMMAMLVGRGIDSTQIIMAAPSRSMSTDQLSGSRLDFDVILD